MSQRLVEHCDEFLAATVGSEERIADFQARLRRVAPHVRLAGQPPYGTDPAQDFFYLHAASTSIAKRIVDSIKTEEWNTLDYRKVRANAGEGISNAFRSLWMLALAYDEYADAPQYSNNVETNADVVLRHVYSLAFNGKPIGIRNVGGFYSGSDPAHRIRQKLQTARKGHMDLSVTARSIRSLTVAADETGQLSFGIRYPRLRDTSGRMCPAALVKPEASSRNTSSLLTLMRAVGQVVVEDAYPRLFEIVPATTLCRGGGSRDSQQ